VGTAVLDLGDDPGRTSSLPLRDAGRGRERGVKGLATAFLQTTLGPIGILEIPFFPSESVKNRPDLSPKPPSRREKREFGDGFAVACYSVSAGKVGICKDF